MKNRQACCLLGGMVPRVDQHTVVHLGMYHVFAYRTAYTNNMHPYGYVLRVYYLPKASWQTDMMIWPQVAPSLGGLRGAGPKA